MKISILHPSRGRPQKAFDTAVEWIEKIGDGVELEYIQSLDYDDPRLDQYKALSGVFFPGQRPGIIAPNKSVVEATNRVAKESTGDILVYLSDDFKCYQDWGLKVIKEFDNENRPLLVRVDDCLQPTHATVLTIPIINRALYQRLGYFWHPEYKSMHVDVDLYFTCLKMGALKNAFHLKFPHEHPANGKAPDDEIYRRSAANWDQGLEVFNRRKKMGFPV